MSALSPLMAGNLGRSSSHTDTKEETGMSERSARSPRTDCRRLGMCVLVVLALLLTLFSPARMSTAVSALGVASAAPVPKTVTVGFWQEPPVMVPYWNTMVVLSWLGRIHNGGLWNFDENDNPIPALVEVVPSTRNGGISADGKTLTIKLRKNAKWTDNVPFTSKDVLFTWQQVMNPRNTPATRSPYDKIASIATPDDFTAIVKFKEPYAAWTNLFVEGFLPQHLLKGKASLDKDPYLMAPLGTGPYRLVEWKQGDRVVFERFDGYYGPRPRIDRIYVKFIPSQDAVIAALKTGDVDVAVNLAETQIPALEKLGPRVHLMTKPLGRFEVTYFNMDPKMGPAFFQDVNVRRAVALGLDRASIVTKLLGGRTTVPNGPWANTPWENKNLKPLPYDPAQAQKILDDSGWKVGSDGIRVKTIDGKPVRLSFKHSIAVPNALREDAQLLLQQNLRSIGIDVVIQNYPTAQMFASYPSGGIIATGKFDIYTQFMDYFPDPDPLDAFDCNGIATAENPSGNNVNRVCDKQLEALVAKQRAVADRVERKKIFDDIQTYLSEKVYFIPMFNRMGVWGVDDRVKNLRPGWFPDIFWNVQAWFTTQ
jgi:peptide/nickel transport system substrate-binding protein